MRPHRPQNLLPSPASTVPGPFDTACESFPETLGRLDRSASALAWSNNRSSETFPGESVEEDRYCHGEAFAALPRPAGENKLALVSEEFLLIDCGFEA